MDPKKVFREFCRENFGGEPDAEQIWETDSDPVEIWMWRDSPIEGLMTAVTYGLSTAGHDEWYFALPELMLRVETEDVAWALALALLVEQGRGRLSFEDGSVFAFEEPLAADSHMSAFFLFGPPLVEGEEGTCDLGEDDVPIQLTGCYPIYEGESALVEANLKDFWGREDYDMFSVERPDLSG